MAANMAANNRFAHTGASALLLLTLFTEPVVYFSCIDLVNPIRSLNPLQISSPQYSISYNLCSLMMFS